MTGADGKANRGGDRLKRRLLEGALDDNLRAIRNEPPGRLYRKPPIVRWIVPIAIGLAAVAVVGWALLLRPAPPERIVLAAASGPASSDAAGGSGASSEAGAPPGELDALVFPPLDPPIAPPLVTRLPSQLFPVAVRKIVVDPGHGGGDEGTKTPGGLTEKILALDIAQRLTLKLLDAGFEVSLTREGDDKLSLRDRVRYANQRRADLFVSIHINWFQDGRANRGIETYYLGPSDDPFVIALASAENRESGYSRADVRKLLDGIYGDLRQQESRRLAAAVQSSLLAAARRESRDVRDRGVRSAPFLVLVETEMPAILAEVASLASPEEARLLAREEHRERIAAALFDGIRTYSGVGNEVRTRERAR